MFHQVSAVALVVFVAVSGLTTPICTNQAEPSKRDTVSQEPGLGSSPGLVPAANEVTAEQPAPPEDGKDHGLLLRRFHRQSSLRRTPPSQRRAAKGMPMQTRSAPI